MSRKSRVSQYEILKSSKNFLPEEHVRPVLLAFWQIFFGNCRGFAQPAICHWAPARLRTRFWRKLVTPVTSILPAAGGKFFICSCPLGCWVMSNHWSRIMTSSWSPLGTPPYLYEKYFCIFQKRSRTHFGPPKKDFLFKKEKSHVWTINTRSPPPPWTPTHSILGPKQVVT